MQFLLPVDVTARIVEPRSLGPPESPKQTPPGCSARRSSVVLGVRDVRDRDAADAVEDEGAVEVAVADVRELRRLERLASRRRLAFGRLSGVTPATGARSLTTARSCRSFLFVLNAGSGCAIPGTNFDERRGLRVEGDQHVVRRRADEAVGRRDEHVGRDAARRCSRAGSPPGRRRRAAGRRPGAPGRRVSRR